MTLGKLLTEAHREYADNRSPEGVSVSRHCLLCSIEQGNLWEKAMSISLVLVSETRTVLTTSFLQSPAETMVDRTGKKGEKAAPVHRSGPCLMNKRQMIIAEYCEKVSHHELQAARAEQERRILQEELWRQEKVFREVHQQNLTEMEELRKFQSCSTFDTIARRKLIEDQNTIMELSGRLQELQNEVNCMSDSKDFQDAESVRSGNSHVTNQPMLIPKHPIPEGMLRPSFVSPRRKEGPPCIWDTYGTSGNVFADPLCIFISSLSPQELHQWNSLEEPLHSSTVEKSGDASLDCQPKIQSSSVEKTLQRIMAQTNKDCKISDLHFDKFPTPATFACWKIRFKTEVCTCSQFPTEAMQWIQGSGIG